MTLIFCVDREPCRWYSSAGNSEKCVEVNSSERLTILLQCLLLTNTSQTPIKPISFSRSLVCKILSELERRAVAVGVSGSAYVSREVEFRGEKAEKVTTKPTHVILGTLPVGWVSGVLFCLISLAPALRGVRPCYCVCVSAIVCTCAVLIDCVVVCHPTFTAGRFLLDQVAKR